MLKAVLVLALAPGQEKIGNPEYAAWASCKPGSWVKHKMEMEAGGRKTEMEMTTTLVEVTPEKVVVERKQTIAMAGRTIEVPAKKADIPAQVEKGKGTVKVTETEEEVMVAGKTLKCKLAETEMEQDGQKMQGKSWFTLEIPGGMAKSEFSSPRLKDPMKLTATGWEKK